jgi:hypothetical protein
VVGQRCAEFLDIRQFDNCREVDESAGIAVLDARILHAI